MLLAVLLVLIGMAFPTTWTIIIPILALVIIGEMIGGFSSTISKQFNRQKKFSQEFQTNSDEVFDLLVQAVNDLKYNIEHMDKVSGFIKFKKSATFFSAKREGTIVIVSDENNACNVQITIEREVLFDSGGSESIAEDIFRKVKEVCSLDKRDSV